MKRRLRRSARRRLTLILSAASLAVFSVVNLVPLAWMLVASFRADSDIFSSAPLDLALRPTFEHYNNLFVRFHFATSTLNSVFIAVSTVLISVFVGGAAAYGFSRYPFTGSGALLGVLILARLVTPSALVIPLFLLMQQLKMLNTLTSVIVGVSVLNLPFVIWLLKPFFDLLPKEVEEAALLDGLSPFGVFRRIVLPLAKPGIMTVILYSFLAGWTDLLFPMSFITDESIMPLTSSLMQMQTGYKIYWGELMAGGLVLTLPALVVALALQNYLLSGMRLGYR